MTNKSYSPGLEGVIAGESALSRIDIDINRLILYGYDLVELTENASYEEVAYLLLYGELPTVAELAAFNQQLRSQRDLPGPVADLLRSAPADAPPHGSVAHGRIVPGVFRRRDPRQQPRGQCAQIRALAGQKFPPHSPMAIVSRRA